MPYVPRLLAFTLSLLFLSSNAFAQEAALQLNDREYFTRPGVDVMAFQDIYPEGHQGGVSIIQHGVRVASNGDLRLEATPGQWQPVPKQDRREVDPAANQITTWLSYPDDSKNRKGFNPIEYPDLNLSYQVRVRGEGEGVRISVDLDEPLPQEWVGQVGFNLELFPVDLFGKAWYLGDESGLFPRQANGPVTRDETGAMQPVRFASGDRLVIAPETETQHLTIERLAGGDLELYDGRIQHNNGWFVVRSVVPAGATRNAVEWLVTPHAIPGWKAAPVVQVSQVGYHPAQDKVALVELDATDTVRGPIRLHRVSEDGELVEVKSEQPPVWGSFLRYNYAKLDFSEVREPGLYVVTYEDVRTHAFEISEDVFDRHVWQPTLEYFLPAQMCHMRVEEQYRVWHGLCHMDDARMAPVAHNHFDGYLQGPETMTSYAPGETVPGLNAGGWHDAGDDDLRIESQADEVYILAAAYEEFGVDYDDTHIDQAQRLARIHQPDGRPDLLQQVEHGILSILGGYRGLGRLYRGIIVPTLQQYVLLGDFTNVSDNLFYDSTLTAGQQTGTHSGRPDDRWVFTEQHAGHEYKGIAALAIAGRVLKDYNPALAEESVAAAEALWQQDRDDARGFDDRISAAVQLFLTTRKPAYRQALLGAQDQIVERIGQVGWLVAPALEAIGDAGFTEAVREAVAARFAQVEAEQQKTPYGVPYEPHIWGAGWGIQQFGFEQYFLHKAFPDVVHPTYLLNALNFILGVHPGSNTASFASGVGATSMTTAYGTNRADYSYIPGGVVSGTALIRPDFPEMKNFPYLWQQAEYVMGGGASHFMFLVLAANDVLKP